MKRNIKKIILFFIVILIIVAINNIAYASQESIELQKIAVSKGQDTSLTKHESGSETSTEINYKNYNPSDPGEYTKVTSIAGNVLGIVRNIGVAVAIIALTIIGVKYMIGSVEQKAEYKKSMIPFVIGVIILASSTTLVKTIYDITTSKQQTQYNEGYNKGVSYVVSGPSIEELQSEKNNAIRQLQNSKDEEQKDYWEGYIAGLNTKK